MSAGSVNRPDKHTDMTWIGAIDQGTTSTRFVVYDMARGGSVVAAARRPVVLTSRQPGWAEQDPEELVRSVIECLGDVDAELQCTTGRSLAASVSGMPCAALPC